MCMHEGIRAFACFEGLIFSSFPLTSRTLPIVLGAYLTGMKTSHGHGLDTYGGREAQITTGDAIILPLSFLSRDIPLTRLLSPLHLGLARKGIFTSHFHGIFPYASHELQIATTDLPGILGFPSSRLTLLTLRIALKCHLTRMKTAS